MSCYVGVDVGTGSTRAVLVDKNGTTISSHTEETITWRDPDDHRIFEQSTTNIWNCISTCIKRCLVESKVHPSSVKGISFDATCSLAVLDLKGDPVVVTKGEDLGQIGERNVILWPDHRSEKEVALISSTASVLLDNVGGKMSPFQEQFDKGFPKILWLKTHMDSALFSRCQFFDLPDFLTYRATMDSTRSSGSVTSNCSFAPQGELRAEFFNKIGLEELIMADYRQLGADKKLLTAGKPVGNGLSKQAAEELGLVEGTPVGSAIFDAYAAWLGTVAGRYYEDGKLSEVIPLIDESRHRLATCAGTSTCHIVQSQKGVFVNGVWGAYKDPVFQGWWMNEGGQPATGQLINFIIKNHPAYPRLQKLVEDRKSTIFAVLQELLQKLKQENGAESLTELTKDMHFYPDLHGNRSPIADPQLKGSFFGLALDDGINDLARKYNITLEAIALQTRHIIDEMNHNNGHSINVIYVSGSQAKNISMMQLLADICRLPVVLPFDEGGAVPLGAAMLGRFAAETTASVAAAQMGAIVGEDHQGELLWKIMTDMTPPGRIVKPVASGQEKRLIEEKYKIFKEAVDIQYRWRKQIEEAMGSE